MRERIEKLGVPWGKRKKKKKKKKSKNRCSWLLF
jgi:hypothetical protein